MTFSRRCPSATGPAAHTPEPSGPRSPMVAVIRATAATSAAAPSRRTSPLSPHTWSPPRLDWERSFSLDGGLNATRGTLLLMRIWYDAEFSTTAPDIGLVSLGAV